MVRLKLAPTKVYCGNLKFSVILVCIGAGRPFTRRGLKSHCFTASVEACASCGGPLMT